MFINQKRHGVRYQHHGIYIGDSQVIHFLNDKKGVCETSLEQFCRMSKNKRYGLIHSNCKESRDKVVRQAKKVIKDQDFKYNLAFENCEHFANYCRSGKKVFRI
ncbi:MAG: lecithin retinol acyltransferase family protein [Pseudanabaena sp.]